MSQTSTFLDARQALIEHPASAHRVAGAVLPVAALDPFPAATFALHELWALMRPFVRVQPGDISVIPAPDRPNMTPGEAFEIFGPQLVSFLLFIAYFAISFV